MIDLIVRFNSLERSTILSITEKELREISKREGLAASGIKLAWTPRLVEHLAEGGFDERYGARPLQRAIERLLVSPLARYMVANSVPRNAFLEADVDADNRVVIAAAV